MMCRRLLPVFCLVTFWLGSLPALADLTIHIELRPRYNATPVTVPDPECPVNPDKIVNIVLSPPSDANTTTPLNNFHLCGLDETVDSERLLAEWNGPYVFTFLNKKDSNVSYNTNMYSIMTFTSSGEIMTTTTSNNIMSPTSTAPSTTTMNSITNKSNTTTTAMPTDTTTFTESNNIGLYSLFISPPTYECNNAALEAAARGEEGFYPVFIGLSSDFSVQKNNFLADVNCLKHEYGGQKPNLCATKMFTNELRGQSRVNTLENMFNFAYNEERGVSPNKIKQCNSSESTKDTIQQCSFFDTTSDVWFAKEYQAVFESHGFVKAELLRNPNSKKGIFHVKTSFLESEDAATVDDFVHYDGPVVFGKNAQSAEVYVGLKIDNIDEGEESFAISVENLTPKRKKRSSITDQVPDLDPHPDTQKDTIIDNAFIRGKIWILEVTDYNRLTDNPTQYNDYPSFIEALRALYNDPPRSESIGIQVELRAPAAVSSSVSPILKMDFGANNGYINEIKIGDNDFSRLPDNQINYASQETTHFNFDIGKVTKNIVVGDANEFRNEKLLTLTHLTAEAMRFDHVYSAINKVLRGNTNGNSFSGKELKWSRLKPIVTNWRSMGFKVPTTVNDVAKFKDSNPEKVSLKLCFWYEVFMANGLASWQMDDLYNHYYSIPD